MFSRIPHISSQLTIHDNKKKKIILEQSKIKQEDLDTFKKFFKSGEIGIRFDYHLLTYLNEKPPGGVTHTILGDMLKGIFDYRRENIIYCFKCDIFGSPGSHHCTKTGYCISFFDEFSSIFYLAIAKENLPHFISLQLWTACNCIIKLYVYFYAFFLKKILTG